MSYEDMELWLFEPSGEECPACAGMQGVYSYAPAPPHPNCHCTITKGEAKAELIGSREELVDQYEMLKEVTWVPKGGSSTIEQNWSTGTETAVSGEVGVDVEGVGSATVGGSETSSTSQGGSRSVTFNYDADEGGDSQLIAAEYQVSVYQVIETYRAHWSEGMGADFEFEVIAETRTVESFSGYNVESF